VKKVLILKGFSSKPAFVLFALFAIVFPPLFGHASFFTFFASTSASSGTAEITASHYNSQNIRVLASSSSVNPKSDMELEENIAIHNSALVPEMGPLGTMVEVEDAPVTDEISLYVTRKGDTISSVADLFDVSTNTIIWANNLKRGQTLAEGETLLILPVSGVKHVIRKGETIKSIAYRYKADVQDIESFNGITSETPLVVGETLIIPDGESNVSTDQVKKPKTIKKERTYNTNSPAVSGYFINPVPGARLSQNLHANNGIDLAAPKGTPIYASAGGSVIVARGSGYNGGFGYFVVINHPNGAQTLYAHMSKVVAQAGNTVSQGELIGYVGSTGKSTGPHCHFEVHGAKNPGSNNSWAR
jgi:murein DD-endopeptidase MepM/ murein hydrolase activator NlpD